MPDLSTGGKMTIVAHQDDDILFMNPDIAHSIADGEANTTIYVTAGDAGLGPTYWQGREAGAKAAYSVMTGSDAWIDETVALSDGDATVSVASSYLADAPNIRLYFLRLPDGGGALEAGEEQQLARLESGDLASVTSKDGANTYTRSDLVEVLTGLMEAHAPSGFRLQLHEGETAAAEHTDHVHTSEFSEEALAAYDGGEVEVTHYVHYDSRLMAENLSPEDAALSLEVMTAYAEHDPAVIAADGGLQDIYVTWTGRQYIADQYSLDTDADDAPPPANVWPGEGAWTYGVEGPDAFLFHINASDGSVAPKDWFHPSLDDAWDQDGDHIYDVTRIAVPADGGAPVSQALMLQTTAEGGLALVSAGDPVQGDTGDDTTGAGDDATGTGDGTTGDDPAAPGFAPGTVFALGGEDAFLFVIDTSTGEIAPQGWFTPSADDAWDRNEDHVYELTRIATPPDGGPSVEETLRLQTVADGVLDPLEGDTGGQADPIDDPDPVADSSSDAPDPDPASDPDPDKGGAGASGAYTLSGDDAHMFTIDTLTGDIALQDWFAPDPGDAWDHNEDHVFEVTRSAQPQDGAAPVDEALRFAVSDAGALIALPDPDDLMLAIMMAPEPGTAAEVFVQDEAVEETEVMDAVL